MKKLLLLTLLCVVNVMASFAEEWTDANGTVWTYVVWNTNEAYISSVSNCPQNVVVPSEIDGYTVTCIGYPTGSKSGYGFDKNEDIESVELPATIKIIGGYAFRGCTSLASIDLSACTSIGNSAFQGCTSLASIGDLSTCTSIGKYAFMDCTSLASVGDLSACTSIGRSAFSGCTSLVSIGDLSACTSIGIYVFENCTSLASIDLSACTSIGSSAFSGCTALTSIGDLDACTSIDDNAFTGCTSLTSVGNLGACTSIGSSAFSGCTALTSIGDLDACTSIDDNAFTGCTSLTSVGNLGACTSIGTVFSGCASLVSIGNLSACTSIGSGTFSGCTSLTSIGNLDACTSIDNTAFADCTSLTSIGNLGACTSIGTVFSGCTKLVSIGDLSACASIGISAFHGCTSLVSIGDLSACTSIGSFAFYGCTSLVSIGDLSACTSIGGSAFSDCTSLTSIGDLSACTSIGSSAFIGCTSLTSMGDLGACTEIGDYAFRDCTSLTSIGDLCACTSIGRYAFYNCTSLVSIGDLSACTSIGGYAFYDCTSLVSIGDLSACTEIGEQSFYNCKRLTALTINSTTPPTLIILKSYSPFQCSNGSLSPITIKVPEEAVEAYRTASVWSELAVQIIANNVETDYMGENKVVASAQETGSGVLAALGSVDPANITNLEVEGTINSYDIFAMRNKMPNLHVLDLTNADIVANAYPYYENYNTQDNEMAGYEFCNLTKLTQVKLPKSIKNVGSMSFRDCKSLYDIVMYEGMESINDNAFEYTNLDNVTIPEGVSNVGYEAFYYCRSLKNVSFPSTLTEIRGNAFWGCANLKSLELPSKLQIIEKYAFYGCTSLTEIIIPGATTNIGDCAFSGCSALKTVKTKLVDPFTIGQNTFPNWVTATLYVPMTDEWDATYKRYYWDTQWGQFGHIEGWDPTINDFYIDNDYELEGGTIGGEGNKPNADMNQQAGFHVKNHGHQKFHHVHVKHNGSTSGSLIGDETNLEADKLFCDILVEANRWYFFAFPFDVKRSDIEAPGNWVFRYYDGKERAENARGGWKNLPKDQEYLEAGVGYIFQTNKSGTLTIPVENPDFTADGKSPQLKVHASENAQDASWNFVGNPYLSYYDVADIDEFTSPITVWNGSSYEAVSPDDDDFILQPYQAFFVQKPTQKEIVGFNKDSRTTYRKSQVKNANARARRAKSAINPDRLIVNLTVTDGENTDKTRVVFNDKASMDYDMERDAAKFMSTESVPQLYTMNGNVQYAINERPNGSREVKLGFTANADGTFTIAAVRMDTPMLLKDVETGVVTDLAETGYSFSATAGTYNNRFYLINNAEANGIANVEGLTVADVTYYDLSGKRVKKGAKGVVIANNKKVIVE